MKGAITLEAILEAVFLVREIDLCAVCAPAVCRNAH